MVYNGYYKAMSNIPKMGQLPTPENGFMAIFQYGQSTLEGNFLRSYWKWP